MQVTDRLTLLNGDCLAVMRDMPDASVDAVVCDPPYGLSAEPDMAEVMRHWMAGDDYVHTGSGFMGKSWDSFVPGPSVWREALRVLKPGGHLAAFFGTRTYDIGTLAIRLAGFEVRDQLAWVYAQGFPKSHSMDNYRGKLTCGCDGGTQPYAQRTETLPEHDMRPMPDADVPAAQHAGQERGEVLQPGLPQSSASAAGRSELSAASVRAEQPRLEGRRDVPPSPGQLCAGEVRSMPGGSAADGSEGWVHHGAPAGNGALGRSVTDADRGGAPQGPRSTEQRTGQPGAMADQPGPQAGGAWPICAGCGKPIVPAGIGTALKPAWEPICLARKPLIGTVASNVLAHGTGGINIDGCRIDSNGEMTGWGGKGAGGNTWNEENNGLGKDGPPRPVVGRFPANLLHDGSDEVLAGFPVTGPSKAAARGGSNPNPMDWGNERSDGAIVKGHDDAGGSAARFFYCAKASRSDRQEGNDHPTVKPTPLMEWLARLITPPGGLVLDPFMGSGSTGKACHNEGFRFVGIERDPDYYAMAVARIWDHVS